MCRGCQRWILLCSWIVVSLGCGQPEPIRHYPLQPVELHQIRVTDKFWGSRIETVREVTVPHLFQQLETLGRIENFDRASGAKSGEFQGNYPFEDSDVYKSIEAAAYSLLVQPDPALDTFLDGLIARIASAQEEDGYIMTWRQIDPLKPPTDWSGDERRWSDLLNGHELYNFGHLYEAAAAHFQATGKRTLLDVALRNAELVCSVFGPGRNETPPGHEEIEIGLVRLYQATGQERYLRQAEFFLAMRGKQDYDTASEDIFENGKYWQDHQPVLEQTEAVGHAVRAGYLYSAMTDVAGLLGRSDYQAASERLWEDVVTSKQYLTGGVGPMRTGESFGAGYDLPNSGAYNESCAAIANVFWNHRLFLLTADPKYLDLLERTLYNGALAGLSLEGKTFFYCNPLSAGVEESWNQVRVRPPWQKCACCPPNLARLVLSMPRYILASGPETLYINLFVDSSAVLQVSGVDTEVVQKTDYPMSGRVSLDISPQRPTRFSVFVRIPGWSRNEVFPSDLYDFRDSSSAEVLVRVNGQSVTRKPSEGFVKIEREWVKGDRILLELPMTVRQVASNPKVEMNRGKVAVQRGPLVYCAESVDNSAGFSRLALLGSGEFQAAFDSDLLNGVVLIEGLSVAEDGKKLPFRAIPYYAWAHRGEGQMAVWFPLDTE